MLLDYGIFWLTLAGTGLGGWSVYWARNPDWPARACWGRCVFMANCVVLGLCAVVAACCQAQGLTALGLCLGLLIVAMSWDAPGTRSQPSAAAFDE